MKRGEKVGPEIESGIIDYKRNYPGWSQVRIAHEVEKAFGITIHRSTVGNVLDRNGHGGTTLMRQRRGSRARDEDPAQAERSGHWPALKKVASTLAGQAQTPVHQLIGLVDSDRGGVFPAYGDDQGFILNYQLHIAHEEGGVQAHLDAEEDLLATCLKEHLPDDPAWAALEQWKTQIASTVAALGAFTGEVEHIVKGFTDSPALDIFVKTAVADVIEGKLFERSFWGDYRNELGPKVQVWRVAWGPNGTDYWWTIGSGNIQGLEARHQELRHRLKVAPGIEELVAGLKALREQGKVVRMEFHRLSLVATFPGRCRLYLS